MFILPADCLRNSGPFPLVKLWFKFSLFYLYTWSFLFLISRHLLPFPRKLFNILQKNIFCWLMTSIVFSYLIPHLPLLDQIFSMLLPPSIKAHTAQCLLVADQEDKRWLSSCWCSPTLRYFFFLFYYIPFGNEKLPVKKIYSHFKFMLKTYWYLLINITAGSNSLPLCCGYSLCTYSKLSSSAACYLWLYICSFSYHLLRLQGLWGEGRALFPTDSDTQLPDEQVKPFRGVCTRSQLM